MLEQGLAQSCRRIEAFFCQTIPGECLLVFGEEAGFCTVWHVGEYEEAADSISGWNSRRVGDIQECNWEGDDGADDEQPAPALQAVVVVEVCICRCLEDAGEHLAEGVCNPE